MKTLFAILATSIFFFVAGLVVGRLTATERVGPGPPALAASENEIDLDSPGAESTKTRGELRREALSEWKNDPRVEIARSLARWSQDPNAVVGTVIDTMSDDEIAMTLTSLTSLKGDDLDSVHDLRKYARRLAEIAMADTIGQPSQRNPDLPEVYFSHRADPERAKELRQTEFEGNGRIHAILPMNDYVDDQVFAKWTRLDDGEVMLFDTYPIRQDSEYNWVYLEPRDGWPSGEYSVDFYSSDEEMRPIAGSNFNVK